MSKEETLRSVTEIRRKSFCQSVNGPTPEPPLSIIMEAYCAKCTNLIMMQKIMN